VVLWLAKQEEAEGHVWVKPDTRRLSSGGKLGLTTGIRGKSGIDLPGGEFDVKVVAPSGAETKVPTARDKNENRGTYWKTDAPGEYRVVVNGKSKDVDGTDVSGEARASWCIRTTPRWCGEPPTTSSCESWPQPAAAASTVRRN
jgi:hypothetical protein